MQKVILAAAAFLLGTGPGFSQGAAPPKPATNPAAAVSAAATDGADRSVTGNHSGYPANTSATAFPGSCTDTIAPSGSSASVASGL